MSPGCEGHGTKRGRKFPSTFLSHSPGSEGPEGPDGSHPLHCRRRGGVDLQCAVPAVGRSDKGGFILTVHLGLSLEAHRFGTAISACKGHHPLPEFDFCGCLKLLESEGAMPGPFLSHVHSKEPGKGVCVPGGFFP